MISTVFPLQIPNILLTNGFNQPLSSRELSKSDSEMVRIIECVHQIAVEGVNIL